MPGNVWQFLLNASLVFGMLLMTWMHGLDFFRSESPLTLSESTLLLTSPERRFVQRGDPHPFYVFLEIQNQKAELSPLLFNRLLSVLAGIGSLWAMSALVARQSQWMAAAACCVLFLIMPGLSLQGISAAGGMASVFLFLLGLLSCSRTEGDGNLPWAGACVALAVGLHPAWLLPALGIPLGLLESDRRGSLRFLWGWAATLLLILAVTALSNRAWFANQMVPLGLPNAVGSRNVVPTGTMLLRFLPLATFLPLMLWLGRDRRGIGWWTLLLSIPPAFLAHRYSTEPAHAFLPLVLALLVGLARLPMLVGVRFPGSYQSVFGLQGLLWLSVYLGTGGWSPFPGPQGIADATAWSSLKSRIREAPGSILGNRDIVARLHGLAWVHRVRDLYGDDGARQRVESALAQGNIAYVLLHEDGDPLTAELQRLVRERYEPAGGEGGFVLWVPATSLP